MTLPNWNEKTQQWDPPQEVVIKSFGDGMQEDVERAAEEWRNKVVNAIQRPMPGFDLTADGGKLTLPEIFERFLRSIPGEDATRDGLKETPMRMAKAYMDELLIGYSIDPNEILKTFETTESGGVVIVKDIPVYSLCEHHMLPFIGKAHIAYVPKNRILGLSKFARIVDVFARRLQVQERLTAQVADTLHQGLDCKGVMVVMECEHLCMAMRGAQAPGTTTITSEIRGLFRDVQALRDEALALMRTAR